MDELKTVEPFLISLAVGLMMGLERERRPDARAGLRSFALIALFGTMTALLGQQLDSPWVLIAGWLLVGMTMMLGPRPPGAPEDPDIVTTLAALLCFGFGALLWYGYRHLALALAFAATSALYFKAELHGVSRRLSRQDLLSFLQFTLISVIILPVLPDQGYGPYAALNPFRLWLMVVLISGLSLAGYTLLRVVGPGRGVAALGILGGAVSSTATTLIFARHMGQSQVPAQMALFVILSANLMVPLRLAVIAGVMGRGVLAELLPVLALGVLAGAAMVWSAWRAIAAGAQAQPLEISNPAELRSALSFAAVFGVVLVATAWLHDLAGNSGVYAVAAISGLTDVDAITLSALQMFAQGTLESGPVVRGIVLACMANLVFKAGIAGFIGGRSLLWPVLRGFAAVAAGLCGGLLLFSV